MMRLISPPHPLDAQSFADGVDGAYSEFDGNHSSYSDSVVPGGDNDGDLSERSSAK